MELPDWEWWQWLLLIGIVVGGGYFVAKSSGLLAFGLTTLSISTANVTASDPTLGGKVLIVNFIQGQMGQYLYGNLQAPKDAINQKLQEAGSADRVGKGFKFDITTSNWWHQYPIETTSALDNITRYTYQEYTSFGYLDLATQKTNCSKYGGQTTWYGKYPWSISYFCVNGTQQTGKMGYIQGGDFRFTTDFSLTIDGEASPRTARVGNVMTSTQANLGSDAYVKWIGNFVSGTAPPALGTGNLAAYKDGKWFVGRQAYHDEWKNAKQNIAVAVSRTDAASIKSWVSAANSAATRFISTPVSSVGENYVTYSLLGVGQDGFVIRDEIPVQFPSFVLYIRAETINIYQPTPKAQINYATNTTHRTGESTAVTYELQNIGESGHIESWVECTRAGTLQRTTPADSYLLQNQKVVLNAAIQSYCSADTSNSCSVKAKPITLFPVETASKLFTDTCKPQCSCTPGQKACQGNQIVKCATNCSTWDVVQSCPSGQTCGLDLLGNIACVSGVSGGVGGGFDLGGLFSGILGILITIILIVVALVVVFFVVSYAISR